MLTPTQVPFTGPYSISGYGKHRGPTATALKRAMIRAGYMDGTFAAIDDIFNNKLETALDRWDPGKDGYGEGRWKKIRATKITSGPKAGEYALDGAALKLIRDEWKAQQVTVPALGPVFNGGKSVLMHDLTHATTGIPLYPAFDDAFAAGTGIIAPEPMIVTRASSANPGDACYLLGESDIEWWCGHLVTAPSVGRDFDKGDLIGRVMEYKRPNGDDASHTHWGINVERLWGAGQQMEHHTNYTHGAPLVGAQLAGHP